MLAAVVAVALHAIVVSLALGAVPPTPPAEPSPTSTNVPTNAPTDIPTAEPAPLVRSTPEAQRTPHPRKDARGLHGAMMRRGMTMTGSDLEG